MGGWCWPLSNLLDKKVTLTNKKRKVREANGLELERQRIPSKYRP